MFYDFHIPENMFKVENLLVIYIYWHKSTKVTVLILLKYYSAAKTNPVSGFLCLWIIIMCLSIFMSWECNWKIIMQSEKTSTSVYRFELFSKVRGHYFFQTHLNFAIRTILAPGKNDDTIVSHSTHIQA